ncbi:FBP domain-containing protein [[Actinomadura] parvosata]|uniref:FBP domain-containing protein n=1 Tax=[Actinomadura] parvosata TaxID=1955412 RepID=UPI00406C3B80
MAEHEDGLVEIALRAVKGTARGFASRSMCSLCLTIRTEGGVALMSARRTGEAGRLGNTVGQYLGETVRTFVDGRRVEGGELAGMVAVARR